MQVLSEAGHSDQSEAQLREGDRPHEGTVERNGGPTYRNRIAGEANRGEQAQDCEAPVAECAVA